jgi:predicted RNA-binding protein YlxR (DUF448 family)
VTATERLQNSGKSPKGVARTCVGCRVEGSSAELVRLILTPDGKIAVDLAASRFGRGAWVHARPECVKQAAPRGLSRSFRKEVTTGPEELVTSLRQAANMRATGLLAAGARARLLALGSTSAQDALNKGRACLFVVATDARAAASAPWIEQVIAQGRALAWGTKDVIGAATGRGEVAVVAVLDSGLAAALGGAIAISQMPMPRAERRSRVTEVG